MAKMNKNIKKSLQALPSMGMAFIVLGVLLLASRATSSSLQDCSSS